MAKQKRSRVKFPRGKQRLFIDGIIGMSDLRREELSKICNIDKRTLSDWYREKSTMSYSALLNLCKNYNISMPSEIKILPPFWYVNKAARLGALVRNRLYGNLGTPEGRSKGGSNTARKFRGDPEFAKMLSFKLRTPIKLPSYSSELAEFIGIMLGDGYIKTNKTQLGISLNSETDYTYALYVQSLIKELFNLNSSICDDGRDKSVTVLVSSRNLVEFMIDKGLKAGDKVINQVGVPGWIGLKEEYKVACLRGLMDTDGSFYSYSHRVNGKIYRNCALDFTNHSAPLLQAIKDILIDIGCFPTLAKFKVVLHKKKDIKRYIGIVGTNNPSRRDKFKII